MATGVRRGKRCDKISVVDIGVVGGGKFVDVCGKESEEVDA